MFKSLLETIMNPNLEEKNRKQLVIVGDSMMSMLHFILAKNPDVDNYLTIFHQKLQMYLQFVIKLALEQPQLVRGSF
jgi:hypothetical protein